ncbi:MarR family winged helix-turn-helix transcriptional regulator [Novosphingobium sp.]|uniref:MarR family winged helix-turn-helix transcriptional regulator n=1 Tax=Novosphingobium sp. TaxID=1874826 RepID=UPI002FE18CD7
MARIEPGLGELLRHLMEIVDRGSELRYQQLGLDYRPRYTPILRAIAAGARTVTEIRDTCHLTQGAVSQTVALMIDASLLERSPLPDGRKSEVRLTPMGEALLAVVITHWESIFAAIDTLEDEIGHPVRKVLSDTIDALDRRAFSVRLSDAAASRSAYPQRN